MALDSTQHRDKVEHLAPEGWRGSYNTKRTNSTNPSPNPRYNNPQIPYQTDSVDREWRKLFESSTEGKKSQSKATSSASSSNASSSSLEAFDEDEFRDKVRFVRRKLKEAKEEQKIHLAERHFELLERAQLRIPSSLDRLNTLCRSAWVEMIHVYVECGNYKQLKQHLDKFERVYELHDSDRALFTLRHFIAQNLTSTALSFWKDADKQGILDERSYADCINWFAAKPELETEARKVLHSALVRAKSGSPLLANGAPFVLSVHYYNAAMRFYILKGDLEQLKATCDQVVVSAPYGLGAPVFSIWLSEINELVWKPSIRESYFTVDSAKQSSKSVTATESSQVLNLDKMLEIQKSMFDVVLAAIESCGFSVVGGILTQVLRFQLLQTSDFDDQIELLKRDKIFTGSEALEALIESLLLRYDIGKIDRLLNAPSSIPNLDLAPATTTVALISKRIRHIMDNPANYPPIASSTEQPSASIKAALSPSFTCLENLFNTSTISQWHLLVFGLFQATFMRSNSVDSLTAFTPVKLTARVISLLLDVIVKVKETEERLKYKPAVVAVLEWLMSKSSLNIPNDTDGPYKILTQLQQLNFEQETIDFLHYCSHRLDPVPLAGLLHLRMLQLELRKDWNGIRNLWHFACERKLISHAYLVNTYIQILSRQDTQLDERQNAIAAFVILAIKDKIRASPKICYELLQIFLRLDAASFDVPAFWALDKWRRRWRVPLTSNIASAIAVTITQRGDHFIKSEASVRLHADFESYITRGFNKHSAEPLDPHEVTLFEDAFYRWYPMFLASTPPQTRFISSLLEEGDESIPNTNSPKTPFKQGATL